MSRKAKSAIAPLLLIFAFISPAPATANSQSVANPCTFSEIPATFMTAGPQRLSDRIPSIGTVKAIAIPVNLAGFRGKASELLELKASFTNLNKYFLQQSSGKFDLAVYLYPQWIDTEIDIKPRLLASSTPQTTAFVDQLIVKTNNQIDLSQYSLIYFIVPRSVTIADIARGSADLNRHQVRGGAISNVVVSGGDVNFNFTAGNEQAYLHYFAHETGHTLGLFDEDFRHSKPTLGPWNIMSNIWEEGAFGMSAWDRYIQGWLTPQQFRCVSRENLKNASSRIYRSAKSASLKKLQALFIQMSSTSVLVIEVPDMARTSNPRTARAQALIYSVDLDKGQGEGGYQAIARNGAEDPEFSDSTLTLGDSAESLGLKFRVTSADSERVVMTISRKKQINPKIA